METATHLMESQKKNKNRPLIYATMLSMLSIGCSRYEPVIYPFDKTYKFQVTIAEGNAVPDTTFEIKMTTTRNKYFGQYGLKYEYFTIDGNQIYVEQTGYTEDEDRIELHPPRMGEMAFTEMAPFPTYTLPLGCIVSANGSLVVKKSTFTPANGKTIEYTYNQEGTDTINYRGEQLVCFLVHGENVNHHDNIGRYKVTYWFHPKYGFLLWEYERPNNKYVRMTLQN